MCEASNRLLSHWLWRFHTDERLCSLLEGSVRLLFHFIDITPRSLMPRQLDVPAVAASAALTTGRLIFGTLGIHYKTNVGPCPIFFSTRRCKYNRRDHYVQALTDLQTS